MFQSIGEAAESAGAAKASEDVRAEGGDAARPDGEGEGEGEGDGDGEDADGEGGDGEMPTITTNDAGVMQLSSLCVNCEEMGTTLLLPTMIPAFREVILMSFSCPHCGFKNSEVQFGGEIQLKGVEYTLRVTDDGDEGASAFLNRQIVKSDSTTVVFTHALGDGLSFEIPPGTQRGSITTLEGLMRKSIDDLRLYQDARREQQPEVAAALEGVLAEMAMMAAGLKAPFTVVVSDPAGNCFVENPLVPRADPSLRVRRFDRTPTQDLQLGLQPSAEARAAGVIEDENPEHQTAKGVTVEGVEALMGLGGAGDALESGALTGKKEVLRFPMGCPSCHREGEQLMCVTDIPHFKEVIIMAFDCEHCGYRSNEIKGGGAIPERGRVTTLRAIGPEDLAREMLKSDTAGIYVPELELELTAGTLGGMYTTVEGALQKIRKSLVDDNPILAGDASVKNHSATGELRNRKSAFDAFVERLDAVVGGRAFPFTLILRDPLANSFISAARGCADPKDDVQLAETEYERTEEENDDLGISDMVVDDYELPEAQRDGNMGIGRVEDHPTPFFRGCEDDKGAAEDTERRAEQRARAAAETLGEEARAPEPIGAMGEAERLAARRQGALREAAGFQAAAVFDGHREGMSFGRGPAGMGYYPL